MRKHQLRNGFGLGLVVGLALASVFLLWLTSPVPFGNLAQRLFSLEDTLAQWVSVALSAVAAFVVWQTLIATQAMTRSAQRIGQAQVRAYLHLVGATYRVNNKNEGLIDLEIGNTGQSPAKDLEVVILTRLKKNSIDKISLYENHEIKKIPSVPIGKSSVRVRIFTNAGKTAESLPSHSVVMEIEVRATYRTVFPVQGKQTFISSGSLWVPDLKAERAPEAFPYVWQISTT